MKKVSIMIPAYNESASLHSLYAELAKLMDSTTHYLWEVLFINDGSRDNTLAILRELREKDARINFVDLSRNFGKEVAMLAGFDYVTGDCMVIMDADLQDPPETILDMLVKWEEGYDDVYARRATRGEESFMRKWLSLRYYEMLQKITRVDILQNVGDFRLLDKQCIEVLRQFREHERYTKGIFALIGFRKAEVIFDRQDRVAGQSNWNYLSLFNLAIEGIVSFTTAPLRIATILGFMISLFTFLYMGFVIVKTLLFGETIQGYPTLISVILLLGGIQLMFLGILGEYLGRIFNETKRRPTYIAREYNGKRVSITQPINNVNIQ